MECVLCHEVFPSKVKLVQHFRETHSVAKQRPRRSRVAEGIRRIAKEGFDEEEEEDEEVSQVNTRQPFSCSDCRKQFATRASFENHTCSDYDVQELKQSVSCVYCGQKCKNSRGATIHQVFCEQRMSGSGFKLIHYECPADDCGAIFKSQNQLIRHVKNHHAEDGITIIKSPAPTKTFNKFENPQGPLASSVPSQETKSPMVTVTMKPHVGKTDGLQDLSLLITPTKGMEDISEFPTSDNIDTIVLNKEFNQDSASITVEECWPLDGGFKGDGQAVLCVAEDGSVSQISENQINDILDNEKTFLLITDTNLLNNKCINSYEWKYCDELFLEKGTLSRHIAKKSRISESLFKYLYKR